jgi:predicted nucleic acid-binding protein
VTDAVLDASVVLKWFREHGEAHVAQARSLRRAFEAGELVVIAPRLLQLEIVNVAGRRWQWDEQALLDLAASLEALGFELRQPALSGIARWTARGLTAYDATYVALAEAEATPLITDDRMILDVAAGIAVALADAG